MNVENMQFIPLAPPPVDPQEVELERFAQIRAYMSGTHANVQVGQVWENINPDDGDEFGLQQVLITSIDEGVATGININIDGKGARSFLGEPFEIPTRHLNLDENGSGWRVRTFVIDLDAKGRAAKTYTLPQKPKPKKRVSKSPAKASGTSATPATVAKVAEAAKVLQEPLFVSPEAPAKPEPTQSNLNNTEQEETWRSVLAGVLTTDKDKTPPSTFLAVTQDSTARGPSSDKNDDDKPGTGEKSSVDTSSARGKNPRGNSIDRYYKAYNIFENRKDHLPRGNINDAFNNGGKGFNSEHAKFLNVD